MTHTFSAFFRAVQFRLCLSLLLFLSGGHALLAGSSAVRPGYCILDLSGTGMEKTAAGTWLCRLPAGRKDFTLEFDLDRLNVRAHDYDEIRIRFCNRRGICSFHTELTNYPATDQRRSWYTKIAMKENQFNDMRLDLRLDDDGWAYNGKTVPGHKLTIVASKAYRRTPGEPADRILEISEISLIRRNASVNFSETEAVFKARRRKLSWTYLLNIQNRLETTQTFKALIDCSELKYFHADWKEKDLSLAPRESIVLPLTLTISRKDAAAMTALYSERVLPRLVFKDAPEVFPLIGYRPRYVWGTIPPGKQKFKLDLPKDEGKRKQLLKEAAQDLARPFAIQPQTHAEHCLIYKSETMKAESFYRIKDRKTGKYIVNQPWVHQSYIYEHNSSTFRGLKRMAQAYAMTGDRQYPGKIRDILLEYAYWFKDLVCKAPSATSGGSRLTGNTLDLCYFFQDGVEAYAAVKDSTAFGAEDRRKIEDGFFIPLMMNLYSHNIQFTNMQLHHISVYGSSALILNRCLNLLGDALYGDFGFYRFIDNGFTADGMGLDSGVYHWFGLLPLLDFTREIRKYGIELIDGNFKRIYDFGILNTPLGVADESLRKTYPLAWKIFRDPKYLPTLKATGQLPKDVAPDKVPDRLFLGSTVQKNNGYAWLREQSKYGFRALAINYIMPWDRLEHDRLHFRLFDEEGMLSHEVARVGYTNPGADMAATVSHNSLVVDEKNSSDLPSVLAEFLDRESMPGLLITENPESRLYPGCSFSRVCALFDGILFVGDRISAEDGRSHSFDWPFYAPWVPGLPEGSLNFKIPLEMPLPFKTGYRHVRSVRAAAAPSGLCCSVPVPPGSILRNCQFDRPSDRTLAMHFALGEGTQIADFRIGRGYRPKPGPMLMLRSRGQQAGFACAFEVVRPEKQNRIRKVTALPFSPAHPLSAVWEVAADSGTYLIIVNRTRTLLKCGDIQTRKQLEILKK